MSDEEDALKYGYVTAWLGGYNYEAVLDTAQIPELRSVADVFKRSMLRVRNLSMVLPEVAFWTRTTTRLGSLANAKLGREIELPGRVRGAPPPDQDLKNEVAKQYRLWATNKPSPGEAWQDGCDLVKRLVSDSPGHSQGVEVLMSALLLETWSAFEALLIDTWKTALNLAPGSLAPGVLGNEKSIPLSALQKRGYNISSEMGDVLIELPGKVDLASLSGIKKAYKNAFKDADPEAIFKFYSPAVSDLEALRHLFAHRAGRVDEKFLRRVKNNPILSVYSVGEDVRINGMLVSVLTEAAVRCGSEIHAFVDSWLSELDGNFLSLPEEPFDR